MRTLKWPQLQVLGAIELGRLTPQMLKQMGFMGTVAAIGVLIKGADVAAFLHIMLFTAAASVPAFAAINVGKDKADGSLEVLCALPTSGWTLCVGRMTAVALLSVVSGVLGGFAILQGLPSIAPFSSTMLMAFAGFWFAWSAPMILSALVAGAAIRFSAESMIGTVAVAFLALMIASRLLGNRLQEFLAPLHSTTSLEQLPDTVMSILIPAPMGLAAGVLALLFSTVVAAGISGLFLTSAIEAYRGRDPSV